MNPFPSKGPLVRAWMVKYEADIVTLCNLYMKHSKAVLLTNHLYYKPIIVEYETNSTTGTPNIPRTWKMLT
jgi:hypothetical protein